ncbi:uncharacterized protein RJT20DRAFT_511 [Scheffersomyces xylosifermentans]|uniref:uncharacterized protein n=1 Tax=Scheffersomyces xylosifermentans TaxID=1304137 RepID=UPI00315DCC0A
MATKEQLRKERKRQQNKISQRKHRARQTEKIAALETEMAQLKEKLSKQNSQSITDVLGEIQAKVSVASRALKDIEDLLTVKIEQFGGGPTSEALGVLQEQFAESVNGISNINTVNSVNSIGGVAEIFTTENCSPSESSPSPTSVIEDFVPPPPTTVVVPDQFMVDYAEKDRLRQQSLSELDAFFYPTRSLTITEFPTNIIYDSIEVNFRCSVRPLTSDVITSVNLTNPDLLNILVQYADTILEELPRLQGFAIALGGYQWVCGQLLMIVFERPELRYLLKLLFPEGMGSTPKDFLLLKKKLLDELESRLKNRALQDYSSMLTISPYPYAQSDLVLCPSYFKPTALQDHLMKHNIPFKHLINFIIWPEFRDALLKVTDEVEFSSIIHEVMDHIVVRVRNNPPDPGKLFFVKDLKEVVKMEFQRSREGVSLNLQPVISSAELVDAGIKHPMYWKFTRSFGRKYSHIVPEQLVIFEVDDLDESSIVRPGMICVT